MRTNIKFRYIFIIFSLWNIIYVKAQVTSGTNTGNPATDYCGWNNATSGQLMIKNESNNPINFLTNTGAGGTTPVRMTILGGGNVGIGTTTPSIILGIDGNSAQTFGLERHTTSGFGGNNFTIRSGGTFSGATNANGGNLILTGGTSTGTGTSAVHQYTSAAGYAI
jgi:hypothetical protein